MLKIWDKFMHTKIKSGTFKYKVVVFFVTIYTYLFTKGIWKSRTTRYWQGVKIFFLKLDHWRLRSQLFWYKQEGISIFNPIYKGFIHTFTKPKLIPMGGNDGDLIYWYRCERCGTMVQEDHSDPACMEPWDCPTCVSAVNFPFKFITHEDLKKDKKLSRFVGACAGQGMGPGERKNNQ